MEIKAFATTTGKEVFEKLNFYFLKKKQKKESKKRNNDSLNFVLFLPFDLFSLLY